MYQVAATHTVNTAPTVNTAAAPLQQTGAGIATTHLSDGSQYPMGPPRPPAAPQAAAPPAVVLTSLYTTAGDPSTNTPAMNKGDILKVMQEYSSGWIDVVTPAGARGYVWRDWTVQQPLIR